MCLICRYLDGSYLCRWFVADFGREHHSSTNYVKGWMCVRSFGRAVGIMRRHGKFGVAMICLSETLLEGL